MKHIIILEDLNLCFKYTTSFIAVIRVFSSIIVLISKLSGHIPVEYEIIMEVL